MSIIPQQSDIKKLFYVFVKRIGVKRNGLQRFTRKLLVVMVTFIILIVVMILQVYTYVKLYQIVYFKCQVLPNKKKKRKILNH